MQPMKVPLGVLAFLLPAISVIWAQPFGLTNRVPNTTLRMPLTATPLINYRIPADNPFVGATSFNGASVNSNQVRTEFYAVGLRNPWRFSFDLVTSNLWLADVGQGAREEVNIIHKGGNYGWNYREGLIAGPEAAPPGFVHINPIQDYGRSEGASVTGGIVYRGSKIPALHGFYIFADYVSGNVWKMRYEVTGGVTNITPYTVVTNEQGIACFGADPSNGDVLVGDLDADSVKRLVQTASGYSFSNAFPGLSFADPVVITRPPGETNRLFVVEQVGRITVITNLANPTKSLFMDITARVRGTGEQGLLGLAFHPGYATNRYFYVFYTSNTNGNQTGTGDATRHDRLSRFEISATNTNQGAPNSELILLQQRDEASNHNAGDVHFGPDGYLYVTLGDEGGANDQFNNSQVITNDFFSGIMRIDVDNRPGSLMPNPHPANTMGTVPPTGPPTLAETGAFDGLATLTPHAGIIPYDVNTPYWTDGAIKRRWFSIPQTNLFITFRPTNVWTFPIGTVWIQHFDLEMTNGAPESRRPIETRFLVRDTAAVPGQYGATYRWDSPTSAVLVPAEGSEEIFEIDDGGTPRFQTWRYPGRAECLVCHNQTSGRALGFNTPQLNRDFDYGEVVDNQIRALHNAKYFNLTVTNMHALPVMARLDDGSFSAQHRARSYLMANCAHCHYPSGPGQGTFDARIYRTFSAQGILEGSLIDNLGDPSNRVIRAGSLEQSIAYVLMASEDGGVRMPPSGASMPDERALEVFRQWIFDLPGYSTFAAWQIAHFGATNAPNAAPTADPDGDGARNQLEYFTRTDPNNPSDAWEINIQRTGAGVDIVFTQAPNFGFEVQWSTNLANPAFWRVLNIPANRPWFSGDTISRSVPDVVEPGPLKAYRARVYEP